jgi:DNA-binding GntR family transcriptional regulator
MPRSWMVHRARLTEVSPSALRELLFIRDALEFAALEFVAARITDEQLAAGGAIARRVEAISDGAAEAAPALVGQFRTVYADRHGAQPQRLDGPLFPLRHRI